MQRISIFDMFKIGVGPSSSHTMGPWRAATRFVNELTVDQRRNLSRIQIDLYGSLAKTGRGHGTDIAVQLGLAGEDPETIDVQSIDQRIKQIAKLRLLEFTGSKQSENESIRFDPATDIVFHNDETLPFHPNGLKFAADVGNDQQISQVYYSVGGGFIVTEQDLQQDTAAQHQLPFPIDTACDLLNHCRKLGKKPRPISHVVMQNELTWREPAEIREQLLAIKNAMFFSIHRGCCTDGILPGGLKVQRRAAAMAEKLLGQKCPESIEDFRELLRSETHDFQKVLSWVSCFALAVNEENAAFGRVVTAPTNGAAGVIPAVLLYCLSFCEVTEERFEDFLLVAGEIGSIFKKGATISAAMGGCQAEIGVSSAMAAAALTECLGGTPGQVAEAAEIAMEHHLGMTCDPIGGLVQIPCIERNAMGAIKAITAAQMSLARDPSAARVSLDAVIRTMWQTAQDMNAKYKETSEGGLAVQIAVNVSEC